MLVRAVGSTLWLFPVFSVQLRLYFSILPLLSILAAFKPPFFRYDAGGICRIYIGMEVTGRTRFKSEIRISTVGFDPAWKIAHSISDRVGHRDTPESYA